MARIFFVRSAHRKLALFEKCIHNGLRDKGFFTPRVWVAEDASPELGSVVVMDLVPGAPLMAACSWRVSPCAGLLGGTEPDTVLTFLALPWIRSAHSEGCSTIRDGALPAADAVRHAGRMRGDGSKPPRHAHR